MIIDRLAKESEWVRGFCDRSHVIQAPFAIFPPQESNLPVKTALVPRNGDMISGQFAKPLFESTVIFGNGEEGREQGALFVQSSESGVVSEDLLRLSPDDTTHVLLVTVVGFTLRFDCLVAYRFLAYCGSHFSSPPNMELVLELSKQAFVQVNGGLPEQAGAVYQIGGADWRSFVQHQVGAVAALFALLNCKNLVRDRTAPDAKLQRSRKRSGKLPLYAYSSLKMMPLGRSGANGDAGSARAIHWVRGHFKEYSPERPLFGKIAGLFWWEPHLAGTAASSDQLLAG